MAVGRPLGENQQRHPELEELALWLCQGLGDAGYCSVNEFLRKQQQLRGKLAKNAVYGAFGARRLLDLEASQSLAVALKRDPKQVEPIWMRAKAAMDRAELAAQRAREHRVTSWDEIPSLKSLESSTPALLDLLDAQSVLVERLPYKLLGVQAPPLSSVYVRQQVRAQVATEPRKQEDTAAGRSGDEAPPVLAGSQLPVSILTALEQHDHLLITGEPGAGKSTMSSDLAHRLSRLWLRADIPVGAPTREPVVPLRVSARFLGDGNSWSTRLANAARRSLGECMQKDLDTSLVASQFQGVRWLVLVDGLDEIPDPWLRADVIRLIAHRTRPGSDYRFVVTTRPLLGSELTPLRTGNVGDYVMEPFGRHELKQFASKWFTVQQVPFPVEETKRFLLETDGGLRELVRNPLLATIAAVSAVIEPDRNLPTNRIGLYRKFCGYLADERINNRDSLAQLYRRYEYNPDLLACVQWLHRSRREIIGALAPRWLKSQDKLWDAAVEWARNQAPKDVQLVNDWEYYLREQLVGTGLLVAGEGELRFWHRSFAEFLSAESRAKDIGDDFGELDEWIRLGLREEERTFVLFTFAIWADESKRDIGAVISRILSSLDPRRLLFAGRLMAEIVSVAPEVVARVIDRLFVLVRHVNNSNVAKEGFEVLSGLFGHPSVTVQLYALASNMNVELSRRVSALEAFERLKGGKGGERVQLLLAELLPSVDGESLLQCARIAVRIDQEAVVDMTRQRVLQMLEKPGSSIYDRIYAVKAMRILRLESEVADLARLILGEPKSGIWYLQQAAEAWLAVQGKEAVDEIAVLVRDRSEHDHAVRAWLAAFLGKEGNRQIAESLADAVLKAALEDETVDGHSVVTAAETLLSVRGAAVVPKVLRVVDHWSERGDRGEIQYVARMLKCLAAYSRIAVVSRVSNLLENWDSSKGDACELIEAWLAAEPKGESVLETIRRSAARSSLDQAQSAEYLQAAGEHAAATELAERVLRSQQGYPLDFKRAASVLLKVKPDTAVSQLMLLGKQSPEPEWLAGVMDALDDIDPKEEQARVFCARALVDHPQVDGWDLCEALQVLLYIEGESVAHFVADTARTHPKLDLNLRRELACALAAVGQRDLAWSVWADLLEWQCYTAHENFDFELVENFLHAGVEQRAAERMRELIDNPATIPLRKLRLQRMLAWLMVGCGSVGTSE